LQKGEVSIGNLARRFKVSGMTIRRDLDALHSFGEIIRTHGGAALAKKLTFEFTFHSKQNAHSRQKQQIANRAVSYVTPGQVIMLDTGTTTLQIAQQLAAMENITIVSTSLAIVSELQFSEGIEVVLLGGFLRSGSPDIHGPLTEQNVDQFNADVVFMGADAIDEQGYIYTNDLRVVNLDRKMVSNAKTVIIVADSSKFGSRVMCKLFGPEAYDRIITDCDLDKTILKKLNRTNTEIELA